MSEDSPSTLLQNILDFKAEGGLKGALKTFRDSLSISGLLTGSFKNGVLNGLAKATDNDISFSFSPVLATGLRSSKPLKVGGGYFNDNFAKRPWVTLKDEQCGTCPPTRLLRANKSKNYNSNSAELPMQLAPITCIDPYVNGTAWTGTNQLNGMGITKHRNLEFSSDTVSDIMSFMAEIVSNGGITVPYCIGQCGAQGDVSKRISGSMVLEPSKSCEELVLVATADNITLSNVGYL